MPLVAGLALAVFLQSQSTTVADLEKQFAAGEQSQVDAGNAAGLSIAIIQDGKIALLKQYGFANLKRKTPITAESEFAIGSVSKQFTAACLLLLQEDGKLSIDDPVGKYFPDLTEASNVSIRDLLNHAAGYSDWYPLDYLDSRISKPVTSEEVRVRYGTIPLDFPPKSSYSYSNTNYLIAARIVEKVSGKRFFNFLSERILKPLQMDHTVEYRQTGKNFTERYTRFFDAPIEIAVKEAPGWCLGAATLVSTAEDLAKWDIALMDGKVLKPESWLEMIKPRTLGTGKISRYALGLENVYRGGLHELVHGGGMAGSNSFNGICPQTRNGCVALSNCDAFQFESINGAIRNTFVPGPKATSDPSPHFDEFLTPYQIRGASAEVATRDLLSQLASGQVDRTHLTGEMNELLDSRRLRDFSKRMASWGTVTKITADDQPSERGRMEVTSFKVEYSLRKPILITMFRTKEGMIAEFLLVSHP